MRAEQLRVVQVTMRTVQDIVNNCLNQLLLLRMDAEGHVPAESLELYDQGHQGRIGPAEEAGGPRRLRGEANGDGTGA